MLYVPFEEVIGGTSVDQAAVIGSISSFFFFFLRLTYLKNLKIWRKATFLI